MKAGQNVFVLFVQSKESNTTKPQLGNIFSGLPLDETKTNTQENGIQRSWECFLFLFYAKAAETTFFLANFLHK